MKPSIIVIGAGGHAVVVADALLAAGESVLGFTDADPRHHGQRLCGLPVLGDDATVLAAHPQHTTHLVNGIGGVGGTELRQRVQERLQTLGWRFVGVRHPSAIVSSFARVEDGVQLLAGSVVQAGAEIGAGCIVNTAAVVEHDCRLGEHVHVAPRALLCGGVEIGARSCIGAGAVVRQGLRLGNDTVVGAGAVVIRNHSGGGTLIGVPAMLMDRQS